MKIDLLTRTKWQKPAKAGSVIRDIKELAKYYLTFCLIKLTT
ncbi:hypothetical protein RintRC_4060 [Richelia intracellularis]|nr:hypothetical protein RintRC_4060 [Richelia intracellularis]